MRHKSKRGAVLGLLLLCMVLFSSCKVGDTTVYFATSSSWHQVFKIGSLKCNQVEAKVYLANYKNIYGIVQGNSLWTEEYDTSAMEDSIKSLVLEHLTKVYALNQYALDNDIKLTDSEKEACKSAAESYFDSLNKAEKRYTGASKSKILDMYERYALAEKVYFELMGTVDEEVSEDEARVMEAYVFYVSDEDLANTLLSRIRRGESFETIANTYNEASAASDVTFPRNTYPEAVEDVLFRLDNDEMSGVIDAGNGTYYIAKCINKYDEELSEKNKANVIASRQEQVILDIITELDEKYYSDFNSKLWNRITIDTDEDITTDSFFSTLNEYLSY